MRLEKYITKNGISRRLAAQEIGIREMSLGRYINNRRYPEPEILRKIYDWSGGEVTPNDFFLDDIQRDEDSVEYDNNPSKGQREFLECCAKAFGQYSEDVSKDIHRNVVLETFKKYGTLSLFGNNKK
jgi:transcriptional regulator with XRE-family HTH domain